MDGASHEPLPEKLAARAGALPREQLAHNYFHPPAVRHLNVIRRHAAEKVDDVGFLRFVPPAGRLGINADGSQRGERLLNLDLLSAMGEVEGQGTIDYDFHADASFTLRGGREESRTEEVGTKESKKNCFSVWN